MVIIEMLAFWQIDINSLTTILQMTPAERLASEDNDMFFPSMHIMLLLSHNLLFVGTLEIRSFTRCLHKACHV